jgi:hypothetical protein
LPYSSSFKITRNKHAGPLPFSNDEQANRRAQRRQIVAAICRASAPAMVAIMPFDTLRIRQSNLLNFGGGRRAAIARRAARAVAGDRVDTAAGDFADAAVVGDTDIPGRIYRRVAGQRQLRGGRGPRQHVCRRIHPQYRKANREVKVAPASAATYP